MADKQITPFQLTDQFTMDNFNQRINETNIALQSKPNPNLLDNWYFGNPVDQRGGYVVPPGEPYYIAGNPTPVGYLSGYTTVEGYINDGANPVVSVGGTKYVCNNNTDVRGYTGEVYGIDRWIAQWTGDGVTLIEDGCISIYRASHDSHICQRITDDLGGQTVTVSAICKGTCTIKLDECDSGWAFKSYLAESAAVSSNDYTLITATGVVPQGCKNLIVEIVSASGVKSQFKAAKLELGTQQTLAHQDSSGNWVLNEIPDYGEQLRRCQRYYIDGSGLKFYSVAKTVELGGTYKFMIPVTFPVTMRETPAVSVNVAWSYGDPTEVYASDVTKGSTTIIVAASSEKVVGVTVEITAIANL